MLEDFIAGDRVSLSSSGGVLREGKISEDQGKVTQGKVRVDWEDGKKSVVMKKTIKRKVDSSENEGNFSEDEEIGNPKKRRQF